MTTFKYAVYIDIHYLTLNCNGYIVPFVGRPDIGS